jgi:hypothetical protein
LKGENCEMIMKKTKNNNNMIYAILNVCLVFDIIMTLINMITFNYSICFKLLLMQMYLEFFFLTKQMYLELYLVFVLNNNNNNNNLIYM